MSLHKVYILWWARTHDSVARSTVDECSTVCRAISGKTFIGLSQYIWIAQWICVKWCTKFGNLCEYVPSCAKLSEASENMCQVVHNFQRPLKICAKWCTTFGGLCELWQKVHIFIVLREYVFGLPQCMTNSGSQPNSIVNLVFKISQ